MRHNCLVSLSNYVTHSWRASLKIFSILKVLLIQFFPVAFSVIFLLVYAKCNFASVSKLLLAKLCLFVVGSSLAASHWQLISICSCFICD